MAVIRASLEDIIPFVIAAVWLVVQIAGAAAKKKAAPRARPQPRMDDNETKDPPALSEVDGFAELMRRLGGAQEFKIPTTPDLSSEALEKEGAEPIADAVPFMATPHDEPPPHSQPVNGDATPFRVNPQDELPSRSIPVQAEKIADVDIRPTMQSFKTAMPAMKLPSMNLSFRTSGKSGSGLPRVGKIINPADKQSVRRALLGQIILGKPRALEGWNTGRVE